MIWVVFLAMCIIAAYYLLSPVLSSTVKWSSIETDDYLKQELEELDRGERSFVLTEEEANMERVEIKKRILALSQRKQRADKKISVTSADTDGWDRRLLTLITGSVPALSLIIYATVGSPELANAQHHETRAAQSALLQKFGQNLSDQTSDVDVLLSVAMVQARGEEYTLALSTLDKAISIEPDNANIKSIKGELLVRAANGLISSDAIQAFNEVLALDPSDIRARYFIGLGTYQAGNVDDALTQLVTLANEAPAGAEWRQSVVAEIDRIARAEGRDLDGLGLKPQATPPSAGQLDENTAAMAATMVENLERKLEENADDLEGWLMLGRSYLVLGREEDAIGAYETAMTLDPSNVDAHVGVVDVLLRKTVAAGKPVDAPTLAALEKLNAVSPDHPTALFFLGIAARDAGDKEQARVLWLKLLEQIPDGRPEAEEIKSLIDEL